MTSTKKVRGVARWRTPWPATSCSMIENSQDCSAIPVSSRNAAQRSLHCSAPKLVQKSSTPRGSPRQRAAWSAALDRGAWPPSSPTAVATEAIDEVSSGGGPQGPGSGACAMPTETPPDDWESPGSRRHSPSAATPCRGLRPSSRSAQPRTATTTSSRRRACHPSLPCPSSLRASPMTSSPISSGPSCACAPSQRWRLVHGYRSSPLGTHETFVRPFEIRRI